MILIIDDEVDIAEEMADLLEATGRHVKYASSSVAGLAMALSQEFRIIITDVRMPEMDGPALVRRIAHTATENPPHFIFVSGHLGALDDFFDMGNIEYSVVNKPVDIGLLLSEIERIERERLFLAR